MKITICGSSSFRKEKLEIKNKLEKLGHEAILDDITIKIAGGQSPELEIAIEKNHSKHKKENDLIKMYYDFINQSDAILVCNFDKNGIKGYIGANTFLEIGYAHVLGKKIFLLNSMPDQKYINDEIKSMDIFVLYGEVDSII